MTPVRPARCATIGLGITLLSLAAFAEQAPNSFLGEPHTQAPSETFSKETRDSEDYLFETSDASLLQVTHELLDALPQLPEARLDPDLIQFGVDYHLGAGTGTAPGAQAQVALCGFDYPDIDPGSLDASLLTGELRDDLDVLGKPVCCTFDQNEGRYRCGDRSSFPNRERTFSGARGDSLTLNCFDVDGGEAQSLAQELTGTDGTPLRVGRNCCAFNLSRVEHDQEDAFSIIQDGISSGPFSALSYLSQCAPAISSTGTVVEGRGGQVQFSTEVFVDGGYRRVSERRSNAYSLEAEGRISYISNVVRGAPDTRTFRGRFSHLGGEYRHYFGAVPWGNVPWMAHVGAELGNSTFDLIEDGADILSLPLQITVGGGFGRLYDIEPRIKLKKLEAMLLERGVINAPIPHPVARDIMIVWWQLRREMGYDQRLLYTFKVLKDAGLLGGGVSAGVVYRFGQILNDPQLARREQGGSTRLGLRVIKRIRHGLGLGNGPLAFVIEAGDTRVVNLSYDSTLYWNFALRVAPRRVEDAPENILSRGELIFPAMAGGLIVLNLPIGYRSYRHDGYLNKMGLWELEGRLTSAFKQAGTTASLGNGISLGIGTKAKYTLFTSATRGLDFILDGSVGLLNNNSMVYAVVAGIAFSFGRGQSFFVAPGDLGAALPFDLPLPAYVTGR